MSGKMERHGNKEVDTLPLWLLKEYILNIID